MQRHQTTIASIIQQLDAASRPTFRLEAIDINGVPAKWSLAPGSDPPGDRVRRRLHPRPAA